MPAVDPSLPSRRAVLRGMLLGGAAVAATTTAGCTDPAIRPTRTPSPPAAPSSSPPPPPPPGLAEGVTGEATALAWCRAVAERRYELPAGRIANLELAARIHQRHLIALELPDPQTRPSWTATEQPSPDPSADGSTPTPTTPLPSITLPTKESAAIKELAAAVTKTRGGHRERAAIAAGGLALLWASLAASAAQTVALARRSTRAPEPPPEASHPPYRPMSETAAAQALLAQLHAIIFGYQVALAPLGGEAAAPYAERLAQLRRHRDLVRAALDEDGASAPPAEPEYDTGKPVTDDGSAIALVARMEHALLPHLGNWVAGLGPARREQRRTATDWLSAAANAAVRAGAAPVRWPGWPD